jgi:hypothetical protein
LDSTVELVVKLSYLLLVMSFSHNLFTTCYSVELQNFVPFLISYFVSRVGDRKLLEETYRLGLNRLKSCN